MNNLNIISEEARKSILLSEEGAKKKGEVTTVAAAALRAQQAGQSFDLEATRNELELNAPIHGARPKFDMPE